MSYNNSQVKQEEKMTMPKGKFTERRKQLHNDDYKDYLEWQLQESEQTLSGRNVHINLYQDRLKHMEEMYKKSIDEIQEIRFKYHSTVKQLTNVKRICDQLENENAKLYNENKKFQDIFESHIISSNGKSPEPVRNEEDPATRRNMLQEALLTLTAPTAILIIDHKSTDEESDTEDKINEISTTGKGETLCIDDLVVTDLESLLLQQNTELLDSLVDKIVYSLKEDGLREKAFLYDCNRQQATKNKDNQDVVSEIENLKQQVYYLQQENLHLKYILLVDRPEMSYTQRRDELIKNIEGDKEDLKKKSQETYIKKLKDLVLIKHTCIDVNSPVYYYQSIDVPKRIKQKEDKNNLNNEMSSKIVKHTTEECKGDSVTINMDEKCEKQCGVYECEDHGEHNGTSFAQTQSQCQEIDYEKYSEETGKEIALLRSEDGNKPNIPKLCKINGMQDESAAIIFNNIGSEHTFETTVVNPEILENKIYISDKDLTILMTKNESYKAEISNLNTKIVDLTNENNRNINLFKRELEKRSHLEEICLHELEQAEKQLLTLKDSLLKLQEERLNKTEGLENLNNIINEIFEKFEDWFQRHEEIREHNELSIQENETLKNKFRILQQGKDKAIKENKELKKCLLYFGPQLNLFFQNIKDFRRKQLLLSNLRTEVNLFKIKSDCTENDNKKSLSLTYDVKNECDKKVNEFEKKVTSELQQKISNNEIDTIQSQLKLFNETDKTDVDEINKNRTAVKLELSIKKVENIEENGNHLKVSESGITIFQQEIGCLLNKECWKISEIMRKIEDWEIMYKNLVEEYENKIQILQIDNKSSEKELQQLLEQNEQNKAEIEKTLKNKINKIREMTVSMESSNDSIRDYENALHALQIENERLKQEVNLLRDKNNIYLTEMNKSSEELKSLVQSYDQELVSHENQLRQLEQRIEFINENQDFTNVQNGFLNLIEKYKSALNDCELEIKNMQESFQNLRKYNSVLKNDKQKLQSQVSALAGILSKCKRETEKNTQKSELISDSNLTKIII